MSDVVLDRKCRVRIAALPRKLRYLPCSLGKCFDNGVHEVDHAREARDSVALVTPAPLQSLLKKRETTEMPIFLIVAALVAHYVFGYSWIVCILTSVVMFFALSLLALVPFVVAAFVMLIGALFEHFTGKKH